MIIIKGIQDEDFVNYKKPSLFIAFPKCNWKCEKECGMRVCQNSTLATTKSIPISTYEIVKRYIDNPITSAIVCGGLEPFDSFNDLWKLITVVRSMIDDDIVIYTGYNKDEIQWQINELTFFKNIVVKFGRFIPGQKSHYDEVLGINLASDNQFAERIS